MLFLSLLGGHSSNLVLGIANPKASTNLYRANADSRWVASSAGENLPTCSIRQSWYSDSEQRLSYPYLYQESSRRRDCASLDQRHCMSGHVSQSWLPVVPTAYRESSGESAFIGSQNRDVFCQQSTCLCRQLCYTRLRRFACSDHSLFVTRSATRCRSQVSPLEAEIFVACWLKCALNILASNKVSKKRRPNLLGQWQQEVDVEESRKRSNSRASESCCKSIPLFAW